MCQGNSSSPVFAPLDVIHTSYCFALPSHACAASPASASQPLDQSAERAQLLVILRQPVTYLGTYVVKGRYSLAAKDTNSVRI